MNFGNFFKLFLEKFDTTQNFLLNPENNHKTLNQLEEEFKKAGGQILGTGAFGKTYFFPSWNYVLKTFNMDSCYIPYARYVYNNPDPCFPKILAPPKRIVPNYTRAWSTDKIYVIKLEKLIKLSDSEGVDYSTIISNFVDIMDKINVQDDLDTIKGIIANTTMDKHGRLPVKEESKKLAWAFAKAKKTLSTNFNLMERCVQDLHYGNYMIRPSTNEIVITDPYAENQDISKGKDYVRHYGNRGVNILKNLGNKSIDDPSASVEFYNSKQGRYISHPIKQFVVPGGKETPAKQKKKMMEIFK